MFSEHGLGKSRQVQTSTLMAEKMGSSPSVRLTLGMVFYRHALQSSRYTPTKQQGRSLNGPSALANRFSLCLVVCSAGFFLSGIYQVGSQ